jgi:hypothetical protein
MLKLDESQNFGVCIPSGTTQGKFYHLMEIVPSLLKPF